MNGPHGICFARNLLLSLTSMPGTAYCHKTYARTQVPGRHHPIFWPSWQPRRTFFALLAEQNARKSLLASDFARRGLMAWILVKSYTTIFQPI